MGHIFCILKLFLSEITNPQDFIQEYVLVACLRDLYLLDKRAAACRRTEMNETIKSYTWMIEDEAPCSLSDRRTTLKATLQTMSD